jgi:Beta-lactamase superfamily domain
MRVDVIGHACLLIRHGALSLLCDPWWTGGAYGDQWFPYPFPVPERYDLRGLDAIYISHGHEDHLHPGTLRALRPDNGDACVLIPYRYDLGLGHYLRRLGFERIREVPSGRTVTLARGRDRLRATILTHLDDSLLAVEAGGEVLVNANDALHASRADVLEEYCRLLRARWPRVDYLFCGFGGASYFPNCVHAPGKDDLAVARERELLFLRNFARIADLLQPRHAFPFAASFVLPDERTWWISAARLEMESPAELARRFMRADGVAVHELQPGDYVADGVVHASERPRVAPAEVRERVLARYPPAPGPEPPEREQVAELAAEVGRSARRSLGRPGAHRPFDVLLRLWDAPAAELRVRRTDGRVEVTRPADGAGEPEAVLETRSDFLRRLMRAPFARDLICVGYGAQVYLRDADAVASSPHERLLDALSLPVPRWRERVRAHPARALRFLARDPSMRLAARRRLGRGRARRAPELYDIKDWVTGELDR